MGIRVTGGKVTKENKLLAKVVTVRLGSPVERLTSVKPGTSTPPHVPPHVTPYVPTAHYFPITLFFKRKIFCSEERGKSILTTILSF